MQERENVVDDYVYWDTSEFHVRSFPFSLAVSSFFLL